LFTASLRLLQQRNEIMQSFFVAVNNSLKNFYHQLAANYLATSNRSSTTQSPGNPHHSYFSTASTSPPEPAFRRCVLQRGANIRRVSGGWQHLCHDGL